MPEAGAAASFRIPPPLTQGANKVKWRLCPLRKEPGSVGWLEFTLQRAGSRYRLIRTLKRELQRLIRTLKRELQPLVRDSEAFNLEMIS